MIITNFYIVVAKAPLEKAKPGKQMRLQGIFQKY